MEWLEKGRLLDTEKATRILEVPPRFGSDPYATGSRWTLKDFGLKGPQRAMGEVTLWLTDDGTWFMTSNPTTRRLSEDQCSISVYTKWDDPNRTYHDLAGCCRIITPRQARRICGMFMTQSQLLKTFPDEVVRRNEQMTLDTAKVVGMASDPERRAKVVIRR